MKLVKNIFVIVFMCFISTVVKADVLGEFIQGLETETAIAQWVQDSAHSKISEAEARRIVRRVYEESLSRQHRLSPKTMLALVKTESGFRANAKSGYGAVGYMQVVPRFHQDKIKGRDIYNPEVNIQVGTTVMSDCMIKHKGNFYKASNCYSGGGKMKYYRKVTSYRAKLDKHLIKVKHTPPVVNTPIPSSDPIGVLIAMNSI